MTEGPMGEDSVNQSRDPELRTFGLHRTAVLCLPATAQHQIRTCHEDEGPMVIVELQDPRVPLFC